MLVGQILALLAENPSLSDREITERIFGSDARHQYVNAACRQMEQKGLIKRIKPAEGSIVNVRLEASVPSPKPSVEPPERENPERESSPLSEHSLKLALKAYLESEGWSVVSLAWGKSHGVDVEAMLGDKRWLIEVKGLGSLQPMNVNYFLMLLGEILQRMDDPKAKYSIALPDVQQFRRLWGRLPALAKSRTTVTALFINPEGNVTESA